MSNTTSEERREAAANLRKIHLGGANKDLIELMLSDAIGAWHENGISWDYITERLADLIDPTCKVEDDNPFMNDFAYVCNSCGEHFSTCDKPNYCPGCGARVVDDD